MVNDLLDYDQTQDTDCLNTPRLFVHEDCKNLRFALSTWTGHDGKHGASKDFTDVMRYFVLSAPTFFEEGSGVISSGGGY